MSTSDSDLASDEENRTRSPPRETPGPWSSSSSSSSSSSFGSSLEAPPCTQRLTSFLLSELQRKRRRRRRRDCNDDESAVCLPQGLTSACATQTVTMETRHEPTTKRTLGDVSDARINPENQVFWQKCSELQCFVPPLSSILHGLRSGRYSQRLSSFQESVAMDRIQRILGVLQNPDTSGRFLTALEKIEEMLQSWFPHVTASRSEDDAPAKKKKQHHSGSSSSSSPSPPSHMVSSCSSTHLKWIHTSPICSLKTPEPSMGGASPVEPTSSSVHQVAIQDSAVSSSTDSSHPGLHRGPPPPVRFRSPCLERLLQAKESILAPNAAAGAGAKTP